MAKIILANAFSFQMLNQEDGVLKFKSVSLDELKNVDFTSVIGNEELAYILSDELGREVRMNRRGIEIEEGDSLYVVSVIGAKLPAGVRKLPEGYKLSIKKVVLV